MIKTQPASLIFSTLLIAGMIPSVGWTSDCRRPRPVNTTGALVTTGHSDLCELNSVLPPQDQPVMTHELSFFNEDLCAQVEDWTKSSRALLPKNSAFDRAVKEAETQFQQLKNASEQWLRTQSQLRVERDQWQSEVQALDQELREQTDQRRRAQKRLEECWAFCRTERKRLEEIDELINDTKQKFTQAIKAEPPKQALTKQNESRIQLQKKLSQFYRDTRFLQKVYDRANRLMTEAAKPYLELDGGRAEISYDSKWDETIKEIDKQNKGLFFRALVGDARLWLALYDSTEEFSPLTGWPATQFLSSARLSMHYEDRELYEWPDHIEGQVKINLLSACTLSKSEDVSLQVNGTYERYAALPGPALIYRYIKNASTQIVEKELWRSGALTLSDLNFWADSSWPDGSFEASFAEPTSPEDFPQDRLRAAKLHRLRSTHLLKRRARLLPSRLPFDLALLTDKGMAIGNSQFASLCAQTPFACVNATWWGPQPYIYGTSDEDYSRRVQWGNNTRRILQPHVYQPAENR